MKKVHFTTLGCKANQYDTQAIREKFLQAGCEVTAEEREADLFVVNTCSVTGEADRKGRALIRRLHRLNPRAEITVTGCYATASPGDLSALAGVRFVVPNARKDRILDEIGLEHVGRFCGQGAGSPQNRFEDLSISFFAERTRAYIKIQDGCNHACTYCRVVLVRGAARSRPVAEIVAEAERLAKAGYREVVLTGIQLGAYGDDWGRHPDIVSVLEKLVEVKGLSRIRLSSLDPSDVTEGLIHFMKDHPEICPHLHLPLQSGADAVLKRMKRAYRRNQYLELVRSLREALPDFALTTDVMVGFPGEGESHFENTVEVLRETLPLKVHIFPFSRREGTRAADFPETVAADACRSRVRRLQEICDGLSQTYRRRFLGKTAEILLEQGGREGWLEGHTANYLKVLCAGNGEGVGKFAQVKLLEIRAGHFWGVLEGLAG